MAVALLPNGKQQFIDIDGNPLVAGTVGMYIPGTLIPKNTWQDSGQSVLNSNPITLDSRGQATIWGSGVYRQILRDANGDLIWDKITSSGIGPSGGTLLFFLSNYATIELANAAAYAAHGILLIDIDYTLTANTTMTAACESAGGIITRGSYTLAFNGGFVADPAVQCFDTAGSGQITIRANTGWSAGWFGAKFDATSDGTGDGTDDHAAWQAMFTNCRNGDPVLWTAKSNIGSQLTLGAAVKFITHGAFYRYDIGYDQVPDRWNQARGSVLNFTDPASCGIRYSNQTSGHPCFTIDGPGGAIIGPAGAGTIGLQVAVAADVAFIAGGNITNLAIGNFETGIAGAYSLDVTFNQCWFCGCDIAVDTVTNGPGIWAFNECVMDANVTWAFRDRFTSAGFIFSGGSLQTNGNAAALSGSLCFIGTSFIKIDAPWMEFDETVGLSVDIYAEGVSLGCEITGIQDLKRKIYITGGDTAESGSWTIEKCNSNTMGGASVEIDSSVLHTVIIRDCPTLTVTDNSGLAYIDNFLLPVNGVIAFAGGGQANATQLTSDFSRVTTVASAADSVKLPLAFPNRRVQVTNSGANALQLYGLGSATINDNAAATGISVAAGKTWVGTAIDDIAWYGGALT